MALSINSRDSPVGETAKARVKRRAAERWERHRAAREEELTEARIAAHADRVAAKRLMEEEEDWEGKVTVEMPGTWEWGWDMIADEKSQAIDPVIPVEGEDAEEEETEAAKETGGGDE